MFVQFSAVCDYDFICSSPKQILHDHSAQWSISTCKCRQQFSFKARKCSRNTPYQTDSVNLLINLYRFAISCRPAARYLCLSSWCVSSASQTLTYSLQHGVVPRRHRHRNFSVSCLQGDFATTWSVSELTSLSLQFPFR